jgi:hypothetical protein
MCNSDMSSWTSVLNFCYVYFDLVGLARTIIENDVQKRKAVSQKYAEGYKLAASH